MRSTSVTDERAVLVTGASRGLGLEIVERAVADGFRVGSLSRSISPELQSHVDNGSVVWHQHDLADTAGIREAVKQLAVALDCPLFGLVNNAAIGTDGLLATQHESEIEATLTTNLLAPILMCKYAGRLMLPAREGRIINISSVTALTGYSGLSVYGATKAGLIGLTKSLAREYGRAGINVNAVAAGFMETAMTSSLAEDRLEQIRRRSPLGRMASVDDVAASVSYLLSSAAASITGTTLVVDAGNTV